MQPEPTSPVQTPTRDLSCKVLTRGLGFYIITVYDFPRLQPVRSSVDGAKYRSFPGPQLHTQDRRRQVTAGPTRDRYPRPIPIGYRNTMFSNTKGNYLSVETLPQGQNLAPA